MRIWEAACWVCAPVEFLAIFSRHDRRLLEVNGEPFSQTLSEALEGQEVFGETGERGSAGPVKRLRVPVNYQEEYVKDKDGNRRKTIRSQRVATLDVRGCSVTLRPPERPDRKLETVRVQVIMVRETDPPQGEDPIRWILVTTESTQTWEEVEKLIALYAMRWSIEVFHRVLKTGCRVEELQLKEAQRIKVAVTMYMLVAWRVLYVMTLGRRCPDLPCEVVFEEDEWRALYGIVRPRQKVKEMPRLNEVVGIVAGLGGYLGRKGDGPPGAQALWVGMGRLRDFTLAYRVLIKGQALF